MWFFWACFGRTVSAIPEEAGKGSDEGVDADAAVGQGDAENQQIAGRSELFDFSERNYCQAIQTETKQGWKTELFGVIQLEMENVYNDTAVFFDEGTIIIVESYAQGIYL